MNSNSGILETAFWSIQIRVDEALYDHIIPGFITVSPFVCHHNFTSWTVSFRRHSKNPKWILSRLPKSINLQSLRIQKYPVTLGRYCPRRDFAQKAKSRGGTLVTRAYIKESTYSWNIQSVCQKKSRFAWTWGREESVGNDDVSIVCVASTKWLGSWRKDRKYRRDRFALRVISDILWSSCFESYGPKDTR